MRRITIYRADAQMQNAEYIMHDRCIPFGNHFNSFATQTHSFCVLHYALRIHEVQAPRQKDVVMTTPYDGCCGDFPSDEKLERCRTWDGHS